MDDNFIILKAYNTKHLAQQVASNSYRYELVGQPFEWDGEICQAMRKNVSWTIKQLMPVDGELTIEYHGLGDDKDFTEEAIAIALMQGGEIRPVLCFANEIETVDPYNEQVKAIEYKAPQKNNDYGSVF